MLIDRTHRSWALATAGALVASTGLYWWYAATWPGGPSGRSWPGMVFGVAGAGLMVFAGLLSARKKTIRQRWGSVSVWLKGHIWLGLLSLPLILFHAAFRWGGPVEVALWVVLAIVLVSGMVGVALQNVVPRMMTAQLPGEAIPDQMRERYARLRLAADEQVLATCGSETGSTVLTGGGGGSALTQDPKTRLAAFYASVVRPYLDANGSSPSVLRDRHESQLIFERGRESLPYEFAPVLDELETICGERRQLELQGRYYAWLHGWLKVHLPLSAALLVLAILHVVTALYY